MKHKSYLFVRPLIILFALFLYEPLQAKDGDALRRLTVQDSGRLKPFDSFAREVLEIVYGKSHLEGRPAHQVLMTWMLVAEAWKDKELFEVRNHQVLKALELDPKRRHFRGEEIFGSPRFSTLRQELQEKRESKEKLTPYFQALQRTENQFFLFSEMASGKLLRVVPPTEGDRWLSVAELTGEPQERFIEISRKFIEKIGLEAQGKKGELLLQANSNLDQAVAEFQKVAQKQNPDLYGDPKRINTEVSYNDIHPFRWAYIFYVVASLFLLAHWIFGVSGFALKGAWLFTGLGLFCHIAGFAVRIYLSERAPVSNMYETVVWVGFGGLIFAIILELVYKFKFILLSGLLGGAFCMVVADMAPAILDPSIQPLEPVLRSNYWLVVHVMTITISYAAFLLAFAIGDLSMVYFLKGEKEHLDKIKAMNLAIYRSVQIGVSFLLPGIILGGIWADYSWGRFWGWDPKETWALIALLGYLAVLHGRLAGYLKEFGLAAAAIMTFSLVIMAWYGVNFVLGAGLHSYGFGAGGVEYVSGFVLLHFLFVGLVAWRRKRNFITN